MAPYSRALDKAMILYFKNGRVGRSRVGRRHNRRTTAGRNFEAGFDRTTLFKTGNIIKRSIFDENSSEFGYVQCRSASVTNFERRRKVSTRVSYFYFFKIFGALKEDGKLKFLMRPLILLIYGNSWRFHACV